MKNTSRVFLIIGRILNIILMIVVPLTVIISNCIAGGAEIARGGDNQIVEGIVTIVVGVIIGAVCLACGIVGLILLGVATRSWNNAKSKDEARKGAICAIIAGVLGYSVFPIPAGILMLCMSDEDWAQKGEEIAPLKEALEAKKEEKPAEEPVEKPAEEKAE